MKFRILAGKIGLSVCVGLVIIQAQGQFTHDPDHSEVYTNNHRVRSGISHGGLGTGSVELRKDGQFYNWSIMNNWPLGTGDPVVTKSYPRNHADQSYLFFLVRYEVEGEKPKLKLLQLNNTLSEGAMQGIDYYYPWMSAVDRIQYSACFPFTHLTFTDPEMPFTIQMEVFSPFIPHDVKNSALPGTFFNFRVEATGDKPVKLFLISTLRNLTSYDVVEKHFVTQEHLGDGYKGYTMTCGGVDPDHSSAGEMGFFSLSGESSYYLGWEHKHPYYEKLLMTDRFGDVNDTHNRNMDVDGRIQARHSKNNDQRCFSSIGVDRLLNPGETFDHTFLFTWNFPNRYGAVEVEREAFTGDYQLRLKQTTLQGHYYSNFFNSMEEAGAYMIKNRAYLNDASKEFQNSFYQSSLPEFVLDQVNSQLNTFISSSVFTRKGTFAIREGMTPEQPWGPFATIDVSLYGSASIIALFPELQKSMMRAHRRIQTDQGEIHHGLQSEVEMEHNGTWGVFHRVDLVPNYIQMVLRDYFWTGDMAYLEEMWPSVVKGIHYILNERDDDHDQMPDMDGIMCSYDNFPMYGLSSYIQSQWLAAMASVVRASDILGDRETGKLAREILSKGSELMNEKLWNGEYFLLSNDYNGSRGADDGILTDQLIGQWVAHQSGLGYLFDPSKVSSSLTAIMESSYAEGFGLRNCTWPAHADLFPIHESELWVDQANTCWSGVELAFASLLIYEGMVEEGEKVIRNVEDRYRKAGLYWDHQEFGGHYYRPMAAWSILHAYLGLGISNGNYSFSPKIEEDHYTLFFSHGTGTAHYKKDEGQVTITVASGVMKLSSIRIVDQDLGSGRLKLSLNGKPIQAKLKYQDGICIVRVPELSLLPGDSILVES